MSAIQKLSIAVKNGDEESIRALVAQGAPADQPLLAASKCGNVAAVRALLRAGADVNTEDPSSFLTPLLIAAEAGHMDLIRLLIDEGADLSKLDREDLSALALAARGCHADVIRVLIDNGGILTDEEYSVFVEAARLGYVEILKVMLGKGAEATVSRPDEDETSYALLEAGGAGQLEALRFLLDSGVDVDAGWGGNTTALMLAAQNGHMTAVRMLLGEGADVNARNAGGFTALTAGLASPRREDAWRSADGRVWFVGDQGSDSSDDDYYNDYYDDDDLEPRPHRLARQVELLWTLIQAGARMDAWDARDLLRCAVETSHRGIAAAVRDSPIDRHPEWPVEPAVVSSAAALVISAWEGATDPPPAPAVMAWLAQHGALRWRAGVGCSVSAFLATALWEMDNTRKEAALRQRVQGLRRFATRGATGVQTEFMKRCWGVDPTLVRYVGRESGHLSLQVVGDAEGGSRAMQCAAHAGGVGRARDVAAWVSQGQGARPESEDRRHMGRMWAEAVGYSVCWAEDGVE